MNKNDPAEGKPRTSIATEGLEPSLRFRKRILNPPRMPIPPRRRAPGTNRARGLYDMTRGSGSGAPGGEENREILTVHDAVPVEVSGA